MSQYIVSVGVYLVCLLGFRPAVAQPVSDSQESTYDVVVYGATPSGIAAAINAAQYGHSVLLAEEYAQIGGLMTSGLSFTDFISYEVLGGTFLDYTQRVEDYYRDKYGADSEQFAATHGGIHAEPHVTLAIFHQMVDEHPSITTQTQWRLADVDRSALTDSLSTIQSATFVDLANDDTLKVNGQIFIDATYEGDLAAQAGAEYW
ncbi:MAG: FAD-dependent oxidoreductase, partial [Tunicatimonas sp.]|uniref:FAD-dependent oxidoreductase n=1 Tax=Tunicatimonas sp. TaxID=1940096 RepID=UPI003C773CD3